MTKKQTIDVRIRKAVCSVLGINNEDVTVDQKIQISKEVRALIKDYKNNCIIYEQRMKNKQNPSSYKFSYYTKSKEDMQVIFIEADDDCFAIDELQATKGDCEFTCVRPDGSSFTNEDLVCPHCQFEFSDNRVPDKENHICTDEVMNK